MTTAQPSHFSYDKFLRSFIGLLLAPVAGGAIAMAGYFLAVLVRGAVLGGLPDDLLGTFLIAVTIGISSGAQIGLVAAFIVGWPLHLILLRTGFIHLATYITFGSAIAVLAFQIISRFVFGRGNADFPLPFEMSLLAAAAGGIGAAIFWLIRRPDHDGAVNEPSP